MSKAAVVGRLRKPWRSGVAALAQSHGQRVSLGQPSGTVLARFGEGKYQQPMRMDDRGCDAPEEDANHVSCMSRPCYPIWRLLWNQPHEGIHNRPCAGQAKEYAGSQRSCVRGDTKLVLSFVEKLPGAVFPAKRQDGCGAR